MKFASRVIVTGADGFIGRNLRVRLDESGYSDVIAIGREMEPNARDAAIGSADIVIHLAGANRPERADDFLRINRDLSHAVADAVAAGGRRPLILYASSTQAESDGDYGRSKRAGEEALLAVAERGAAQVLVYRLPNVFGKWARPNYNSAVATFCHNLARGLPISVKAEAPIQLLYIDDLIEQWLAILADPPGTSGLVTPRHVYATNVGVVADILRGIAADREAGMVDDVGTGLTRALYATFIAALPEGRFSYPLVAHSDPRGSFSEMLKTRASGQFSYFTAHPGITRGGHYHHSKTEKFLIVQGQALFRFRHIVTGNTHEVRTSGEAPVVVETIPGWSHDVTNVGDDTLVALLWANELFDRARPDTVAAAL